jgi:hypothetical protein
VTRRQCKLTYHLTCHLMLDSLFTLDKTTLFYWTLSDLLSKKQKHCETQTINKWEAGVPDNVALASHSTPSYTTVPTTSHSKTGVPSLTTGTSQSCSSVPSVLTNNVKVVSCCSVVSAEVEPEPTEAITVFSDTGLSDDNETNGEEQLVTINSPPKGKK